MAPITISRVFDLAVIGGGSGGVACARRAAKHGASVVLIENSYMGGTCVNVGCVPKKLTYNLASIVSTVEETSKRYGISAELVGPKKGVNYKEFQRIRTELIRRLNGIYERNLRREGVTVIRGWGRITDSGKVNVDTSNAIEPEDEGAKKDQEEYANGPVELSAERILIATGGRPIYPRHIEGWELGIVSDDFFSMQEIPESMLMVGSGYIGIEIGGMLHMLGSKVIISTHGETILRGWDVMQREGLADRYIKSGLPIYFNSDIKKLEKIPCSTNKQGHKIRATVHHRDENRDETVEVDVVMWAVGRDAIVKDIGAEHFQPDVVHETTKGGMKRTKDIQVDEWQRMLVDDKIFAIGDVTGRYPLTPVAIATGRRLADRLFGGKHDSKMDYHNIATVVFSHPTLGSVGLNEEEAVNKFGRENIKIYKSSFVNMIDSLTGIDGSMTDKPKTDYKLITQGPEEKVIGLHMIGRDSDEILQGFAVAVRAGLTKDDFDSTVAIHPTAAEEIVTLK